MSARFPQVGAPANPPGCCLACRRGSDPLGFHDLGTLRGMDLAGDQTAYLCRTCLLELVADLGYVPPEELERVRTEAQSWRAQLHVAEEQLEPLRELLGRGMLGLIERVTAERLRIEMEGLNDGGADPGADAAGGDGGGGGLGPAGAADREPADPGGRAPAGPPAERRVRQKRPVAGAGAGPAGNA